MNNRINITDSKFKSNILFIFNCRSSYTKYNIVTFYLIKLSKLYKKTSRHSVLLLSSIKTLTRPLQERISQVIHIFINQILKCDCQVSQPNQLKKNHRIEQTFLTPWGEVSRKKGVYVTPYIISNLPVRVLSKLVQPFQRLIRSNRQTDLFYVGVSK